MPDVYVAPNPHVCAVLSPWLYHEYAGRPLGSIWHCDECGAYWIMRRRGWRHVMAWNLQAIFRICRWERSHG